MQTCWTRLPACLNLLCLGQIPKHDATDTRFQRLRGSSTIVALWNARRRTAEVSGPRQDTSSPSTRTPRRAMRSILYGVSLELLPRMPSASAIHMNTASAAVSWGEIAKCGGFFSGQNADVANSDEHGPQKMCASAVVECRLSGLLRI
jgi:hypothetical protein